MSGAARAMSGAAAEELRREDIQHDKGEAYAVIFSLCADSASMSARSA